MRMRWDVILCAWWIVIATLIGLPLASVGQQSNTPFIGVAVATAPKQTNTLESLRSLFQKASSSIREGYEQQKTNALVRYGNALDEAMRVLKAKGELNGYLAVEAEKKRFDTDAVRVPTAATNADTHRVVLGAVAEYQKTVQTAEADRERKMSNLLRQYVAALDRLIAGLTASDRIDEAKTANAERERVATMLAESEAKLPKPTPATVGSDASRNVALSNEQSVAEHAENTASKASASPSDARSGPPESGHHAFKGREKLRTLSVDLGDGVQMEFVLIPAGSFMMGSAGQGDTPVHKVTITKPFYMGKYEVTQKQWEKVMGSNPSHFKATNQPVERVSWDDCQAFIAKMNQTFGGQRGVAMADAKKVANEGPFALPTEAQWEYACRAGSRTTYYFGDDARQLPEYAWNQFNACARTHPVGEKKPNDWGLYDMGGNVREWCQDWYGEYPKKPATDPVGPDSGTVRIRRGGSWILFGWCDSASHYWGSPDERSDNTGFRLVRTVER